MSDEPTRGPAVLIVGGLFTSPFQYRRMARRLVDRGASEVRVAGIWAPTWLIGAMGAMGRLSRRVATTAEELAAADGRPIILMGHSAGGLVSRLALSAHPYRGHRRGAAEAVGVLVTLGSPHRVPYGPVLWRSAAHASRFLDQTSPGAAYAPRTRYLTVGSRAVATRGGRRWLSRVAGAPYSILLGRRGFQAAGDGLVPADAAHLAGAQQITFDDVLHGVVGSPWYGDPEIIDRWWPVALELWREALAARADAQPES